MQVMLRGETVVEAVDFTVEACRYADGIVLFLWCEYMDAYHRVKKGIVRVPLDDLEELLEEKEALAAGLESESREKLSHLSFKELLE